jgi:outer membrane lipase/esterase
MGHVQTLNDGLMIGQETPPGTIAAFAATAGGGFDVNSEGTNPGFGSTNRSNTVGVTMRASEAVTVGAGFGKSKADGSFGQEAGGFRTSENVFSIFAGTKLGGFYGNAAASISNIQFTQSRRTFRLGPATRTGEATLSGSNASAFVNAGYDFTMGRFAIGPLVSWTTQNVDVNAFDETGAGSAGLHIAAQNRRSEVGSFGVRASMKLGNWTPYLKYTVDKERKDEERLVSATPLSLASGNTYDMPAYQPADSTWGTFSAGIRGWFTETVGASIGYMKVTGRSGIKEDSVAGVLTVRF